MRLSILFTAALIIFLFAPVSGQVAGFDKHELAAVGVTMSRVKILGKESIRVIKDSTIVAVDEPTFVKLKNTGFKSGTIEVKVLSRLLKNAPELSRGFIGLAFRIDSTNTKFESIYIRPLNARADDQVRRNHSIQYFAYPDYKFDRLRKESPERYESYTDMELNKWINLKIEVEGAKARLYIDNRLQPSLIINDLKLGPDASGDIGLWVDVGTEGYFSDLKIKQNSK